MAEETTDIKADDEAAGLDKNELLAATLGFSKCTFGPDDDECEGCGRPYQQLYFGDACYEYPNDGSYYCIDCLRKRKESNDAYAARMGG